MRAGQGPERQHDRDIRRLSPLPRPPARPVPQDRSDTVTTAL
ncbi:hypothetical protein SFR_1391 [Streptomyces sp. FR-008]|nr:hypothetical protein SFR_1391 [Streptomyces sp. FR-008]